MSVEQLRLSGDIYIEKMVKLEAARHSANKI